MTSRFRSARWSPQTHAAAATDHLVTNADELTAIGLLGAVAPGETVTLTEGTYTGAFTFRSNGTLAAPIVIRNAPSDDVVIDRAGLNAGSNLKIEGTDVIVRENPLGGTFRFTNSDPNRDLDANTFRDVGVNVAGTAQRCRLINLRIDNCGGGAVSNLGADESEIYGCLISRVGWDSPTRGSGHGVYPQNAAGHGRKTIRHCMIVNGYGHGVHIFGGDETKGTNFDIEDCIVSFCCAASARERISESVIADTEHGAVDGIVLRRSVLWQVYPYPDEGGSKQQAFRLGGEPGEVNGSIEIEDCKIYGTSVLLEAPTTLTLNGNLFCGAGSPVSGVNMAFIEVWRWLATAPEWDAAYAAFKILHPDNVYNASVVSANEMPDSISVFANEHEDGRGHVAIVNGSAAANVSVNLSSICEAGRNYEIRDAEAPEAVYATFAYTGAAVAFAMSRPTATAPIGGTIPVLRQTGVYFGCFLVRQIS